MDDPRPASGPPADTAPHAERVRGADGVVYWKLTCFCGKQLLAPYAGAHTHGRCTQCGTRLRLPAGRPITGGPLPVIPARRTPRRIRDAKPRVPVAAVSTKDSADKLRPAGAASERLAHGLISAWPAASLPRRALALYIDITFLLLFTTAVWLAAGPGHRDAILTLFAGLAAWLFNDAYLQNVCGGSLGKLLARVALRTADGERVPAASLWARSLAKLVCLPLFPLTFADPDLRAVHDRLLKTRVLLGRAHGQLT
jgi:uncharacterized RDD family membrane protein YckC